MDNIYLNQPHVRNYWICWELLTSPGTCQFSYFVATSSVLKSTKCWAINTIPRLQICNRSKLECLSLPLISQSKTFEHGLEPTLGVECWKGLLSGWLQCYPLILDLGEREKRASLLLTALKSFKGHSPFGSLNIHGILWKSYLPE